jgi:hypothetical protein
MWLRRHQALHSPTGNDASFSWINHKAAVNSIVAFSQRSLRPKIYYNQ